MDTPAKLFFILFCQLFCLSAIANNIPPEYRFAELFFQEEDYYRSATEYQRSYFHLPAGYLRELGILRCAESFYLGQQAELCLATLGQLPITSSFNERRLILEKFCLSQKNLLQAATSLGDWPSPLAAHQATIWQIMHFGEIHDLSNLLTNYEAPLPEGLQYPLVTKDFTRVLLAQQTKRKSPFLASVLSALFPGAGQWYYESWGDGLSYLSVISLLTGIGILAWQNQETTLAGLVFTASGIFYTAGIYGAWRGAERYNEQSKLELKRQAAQLSLRYEVYRFP